MKHKPDLLNKRDVIFIGFPFSLFYIMRVDYSREQYAVRGYFVSAGPPHLSLVINSGEFLIVRSGPMNDRSSEIHRLNEWVSQRKRI